MSSISFVSVADDRYGRKEGKYSATQDLVKDLLIGLEFSNIFSWKWSDVMSTDFYIKNKKMLDLEDPAMNGRCYKPFVILESLNSIGEGDFLIYNDVSPEHWRSFNFDRNIFDLDVIKGLCDSNGGILSTESIWIVDNEVAPHTHENFTTEICMETMGMQSYRHSIQHASGMMVFRKTKNVIEFVREWLKWNLIPECASLRSLDDTVNYYLGDKAGHRHDQSISGLLLNSMNGKLIKNVGGFNFSVYCRKGMNYQFIETNVGPSDFVYTNSSSGYVRNPRNPNQSLKSTSSYPLNL